MPCANVSSAFWTKKKGEIYHLM
uniref:Uncharacterized protein n=1 Tax=Arundo donax TaxID=35708 RepID=A0A0A9AXM5_ARUDO